MWSLLINVLIHYERNPSSTAVLCLNVHKRVCVLVIRVCVCVCGMEQRAGQCQLNQVSAGQTVNTVSLPSPPWFPTSPHHHNPSPAGTSLIRAHLCHVSQGAQCLQPNTHIYIHPAEMKEEGKQGRQRRRGGRLRMGEMEGEVETDPRCASWCRAPESWLILYHLSHRAHTQKHPCASPEPVIHLTCVC